MSDKASTKGISLNQSEWDWADTRAKELLLDPKSARSDYFRLLVDLDKKFRFSLHAHKTDRKWHLFEEGEPYITSTQASGSKPVDPGGGPPDNLTRNTGAGPDSTVSARAAG